jgi:DNA-binding response OmpR family regulator
MLVEDDVGIRDVVTEYLTRKGHIVDSLGTGREAIEAIHQLRRSYDVALVDWQLPGISGRDVIQTITSRSPETAILITTGLPKNSRLVQRTVTQSQIGILRKPFSLRSLHRRLMDIAAIKPASSTPADLPDKI